MKNIFKALIISAIVLIGTLNINAQNYDYRYYTTEDNTDTTYTQPSLYFGAVTGANFNFYRGSTQDINSDLTSYPAFHNGNGAGLYLAGLLEYHQPASILGLMLQVGYDGRSGTFDQVFNTCDVNSSDLEAKLSYLTIEPSLRVRPFDNNFYLYAGPRFALNLNKSFTYNVSDDGVYPDDPELTGDFSNVNRTVLSAQIGVGYDAYISSNHNERQYVISPFLAYHPYFGQNPRSIETWNVNTLRVGIAIKFGKGREIEKLPVVIPIDIPEPPVVIVPIIVVPEEPVVVPSIVPEDNKYALFFRFDESNLDNQTIEDLDKIIEYLKGESDLSIVLKSYADTRGTEDYNILLSERRAKAVIGYMIDNGIDASRINSTSLGETDQFDKDNILEDKQADYALNRRSNVIIVDIVTR